MAGDFWNDPIEITGTSGSFDIGPVAPSTAVYKVVRWSGTHVPNRRFDFMRSPVFGGNSNNTYREPSSPSTNPATSNGVGHLTDVRFDGATGHVQDQPTGYFYLKAFAYNDTASPVTYTYSWDVIAPPPDRPYTWGTAEDITADLATDPDLLLTYDNVAVDFLEERFYKFTLADGEFISITATDPDGYVELYEYTSSADWDGDYVAYGDSEDAAEVLAVGSTTYMLYIDTSELVPPAEAAIQFHLYEPVSPPAYTVTNDTFATALPLDLDLPSIAYDNTGASQDPTVPNYVWELERSIWYDIDPLDEQAVFRFTPVPSDPDNPSLWPDVYAFGYGAHPTIPAVWYNVVDGWGAGPGDSPLTAILPAGMPIKLVLAFPRGHPGQWETAGTLQIEDVTGEMPEDSDPATPSELPYGSTIVFPDLGSLPITRYMTFVANGSLYNFLTGSPTSVIGEESFSASVYVNDVYVTGINAQTVSQPDKAATQYQFEPGDVVTIHFGSQYGRPLQFKYGASTEEDLTWCSWQESAYNRPDGHSNHYQFGPWYGGSVGGFTATGTTYRYSSTGQANQDNVTDDWGAFDALEAEALTEAVNGLTYAGTSTAASWRHAGHLLLDPADNLLTLESQVQITVPAVNYEVCWDAANGRVTGNTEYQKYAPAWQWWGKFDDELPAGRFPLGSSPSLTTMISYFESGQLQLEWSTPPGDVSRPYQAVVGSVTSEGWESASGVSRFRDAFFPHPMAPMGDVYSNAAEIGIVSVSGGPTALAAWMTSPAFGAGGVHAVPAPSTTTFSEVSEPPTMGSWTIHDADWESHVDTSYVMYCVGSQISSGAVMGGDELRAACPYGFIFFEVAASSPFTYQIGLLYPPEFRVGWYAERFGPPPEVFEPTVPAGYFLDPNANLDGLGDGVDVNFS